MIIMSKIPDKLELLDVIRSSSADMKQPVAIRLFPREKFIEGFIEDELLSGLTVKELTYDEYPVKIKLLNRNDSEVQFEVIEL